MEWKVPVKLAAAVLSVLVLGPFATWARPVEYNLRALEPVHTDLAGKSRGVFGSAASGTTYFGGTYWNTGRMRWEALADSCWTFDTGVGSDYDYSDPEVYPYKFLTGLHAHMEGWVGRDDSYRPASPFGRFLSTAADGGIGGDFDWSGQVCVGTPIGLTGSSSLWIGRSQGEVAASGVDCWETGQGYGNSWAAYLERSFPGHVPSGDAQLSFDAHVETEVNFDFAYAWVDTGDGEFQEVWSADGPLGLLSPAVALIQGISWPTTAQDIVIRLGFESDGAYSDEDGLSPTACGAVTFDNVALSGDLVYGPQGFESGPDGWVLADAGPGIGDFSHLAHVDDLGLMGTPVAGCICDLQDTVMAVFDPASGRPHAEYQDNMVMSPWIDLEAEGLVGAPLKFVEFSLYSDQDPLAFVFLFDQINWYPEYCPVTGQDLEAGWETSGNAYYLWERGPFCTVDERTRIRLHYSDIAAPGAERVRIALGVVSLCSGWAACTGTNTFSPVWDNVKFGVGGQPGTPFLATNIVDTPYDSFPQNGTLQPDATGRVDCNQVNDESLPYSSAGDTLVIRGGGQGWGPYSGVQVELMYFVEPGPGIDAAALSAWNAKHAFIGPVNGKVWRIARMDTAEVNKQAAAANAWMTAYHEEDPNGPAAGADTTKDTGDLNPYGLETRLAYDIFPDDLFTPGTYIGIAYRASYIDSSTGMTTGNYAFYPTGFWSHGDYLEMEVLPSSMASDTTWNCVLYVNHADDRGPGFLGSTARVEEALSAVITGTSDNYEGTPYDIFDVEAPSSNQGSFGRPIGSEYGCSVTQVMGYNHIIWYSRSLASTSIKEPDADVLSAWLTYLNEDINDNRFYGTGDGLAYAMDVSSAGSMQTLLGSLFGVTLTCNSYRAAGCNATGQSDTDDCIRLDPVTTGSGAHFDGSTLPVAVSGNGCPDLGNYDVLAPGGAALDDARANESYFNQGEGVATHYASVSHAVNTVSGIRYRSVLDGTRIDDRRDAATCDDGVFDAADGATVEDRMAQVGTWLGFAGAGVSCELPYAGVDVHPQPLSFVTALSAPHPNPFSGAGSVQLAFSLEAEGSASVEVFDINGRLVDVLFKGRAEAGPHLLEWDGRDRGGNPVAAGVYFYRLKARGQELARKQVVIRRGR